ELARHRTGALITFEQDANLDEFVVGQGIPIDAAVTRELLVTMFIPESVNKLHDGAVIIRSLRIAKAGVFFPMPEAKNVDAGYGSRHRAAIGITEETDAVVVVVSEERGTISFCFNGNIVTDLDGEVLRKTLLRIFGRAQPKKKAKPAKVKTGDVKGRVAIATPLPPRAATVSRKSLSAIATPLTAPTSAEAPRAARDLSTPLASSANPDTGRGPGGSR
ncbi:MAG: DNA integrity scanning protein DisA nucleotide-binding domain protein, partial [Polyangiaceae bacterium]|nr:DNA integrity scanning protein DisA nucleotide-binding domain protein [Polyangiaceae bacterium]